MNANAEIMRGYMLDAGLTQAEVADALKVSRATVRAWMRPETQKNFRRCPDIAVELLRLRHANRIAAGRREREVRNVTETFHETRNAGDKPALPKRRGRPMRPPEEPALDPFTEQLGAELEIPTSHEFWSFVPE